MLPFIAGAAVAYLLDPLADRLQAAGLSRGRGDRDHHRGAVLVLAAAMLFCHPGADRQASGLIGNAAELYRRSSRPRSSRAFPDLLDETSELNRRSPTAQERMREERAGDAELGAGLVAAAVRS
jgi:predicted PurR-regulated permease PerM